MIIIKTPEEIQKIQESCRIAKQVLKDIEKQIKAGITTEEIDSFAEQKILSYGARPAFKGYRGYRHASCISINSVVVHGIPSKQKLEEGNIIGIDVGVLYEGLHGDVARTFAVGKISDSSKKLIETTALALDVAIENAIPGNHIGDISSAIENIATNAGFSVVKDLFGHGVGRDLHEDPLIPNYGEAGTGPKIKPGMVFAIEPMLNVGGSGIVTLKDGWTIITADHSLSAHFEDTILITQSRPKILTRDG